MNSTPLHQKQKKKIENKKVVKKADEVCLLQAFSFQNN